MLHNSRRQWSDGCSRALTFVVLPLLFCACTGEGEETLDAAPPDAAPLTIGDICRLVAPATCERDAECFQDLPPPCEEALFQRCCGDARTCDEINGVTQERVNDCIAAIYEGTCTELEELPVPCREIAVPGAGVLASSESVPIRLWPDAIFATGDARQ
jgi:hypothetical protein